MTKEIVGPSGRKHVIHLSMTNSSISDDETSNRSQMWRTESGRKVRGKQGLASDHARANFIDGLKNSDLSMYVGHGRKCGGPDTEPPIRLVGNRDAVNYGAYRDRSLAKEMLGAIASTRTPPKMMGYFACDANCDMHGQLRQVIGPRSGLVTANGLMQMEVAYAQAYAMLDSVLAMRCEDDFKAAVGAVTSVDDEVNLPPTFTGFFAPVLSSPDEDPGVSPRFRSSAPLVNTPQILPTGPGRAPARTQKASTAK